MLTPWKPLWMCRRLAQSKQFLRAFTFMVAKRASSEVDIRRLKRDKPAMTPEESGFLHNIAANQEQTATALRNLEAGNTNMLDRLVRLDEEMQQTLNYGERLSALEERAGEGLQIIHSRTLILDEWQKRAMEEFEKMRLETNGILSNMRSADVQYQEKIITADNRFREFDEENQQDV